MSSLRDLIKGITLDEKIRNKESFNQRNVIKQALEFMIFFEQNGYYFGDCLPKNRIYTDDGRVIPIDYEDETFNIMLDLYQKFIDDKTFKRIKEKFSIDLWLQLIDQARTLEDIRIHYFMSDDIQSKFHQNLRPLIDPKTIVMKCSSCEVGIVMRDGDQIKCHVCKSIYCPECGVKLEPNEDHICLKEEIESYLRENEFSLKNETSILGHYYKSTSGEFEAHLVAKERDINLLEIKLSVLSEQIASEICDNWIKKNQSIYEYLTLELF